MRTKKSTVALGMFVSLVIAACSSSEPKSENEDSLPPGAVLNSDGTITNADGTLTDKDGNPILDDEGNPVTVDVGAGGSGSDEKTDGTGSANSSGGSGPVDVCVPGIAGTSQVPRLKNEQYDRTIRDLVGLEMFSGDAAVPSSLLVPDQSGGLTALGWTAYQSVGTKIASEVMADSEMRSLFLECEPSTDGCLKDTIVRFGRRAFRRPLTDTEVASFERLITRGGEVTPNGTPEEVAALILEVFLISPSFIQRSEITEDSDGDSKFVLSSHEVASRLSYMLWGTMPDTTLSDAADAGALGTPEEILEQAKRMLQDNRARDMVAAFHRDYIHLGTNTRWDSLKKDEDLFPQFSDEMIPAMAKETELFFDDVVFNQEGSFADLFLSPVGFVNQDTAPLYGLDSGSFDAELERIEFDADTRPGFLTRIGFLNAYSGFSRTSPILRGAFIVKDVMGTKIDPPPAGATDAKLPDSSDLDTNRKRVDAQTDTPGCANCHGSFINPPGFVLEAFDAVGKWQNNELSTGAPIDTSAEVMVDGVATAVSDPADLMAQIANSSEAQHYYAQNWVGYGYERGLNAQDACTVDLLTAKIASGGYTVINLIADLTQAESFRIRAIETGAAQ